MSVSNTPKVTIVVPVFEEAENIEKTVRILEALVRIPHELLVVYDSENDGTLPVVRPLQREFPAVRLVKNQVGDGRGVINALRTGFRDANGEFVCVFTADGTDQPEAIPKMVALLENGYDLVSGARYVKGAKKYGGGLVQSMLSRCGNLLMQQLSGFPLSDATYSFKIYRKTLLDTIEIESTQGWVLSFEIALKAYLAGARMIEIPTLWVDRHLGTSQFRLAAWLPAYIGWFVKGLYWVNRKRIVRQ
jgi:glycosyltransferase involved in cell wall biosynthesis